MGMQYRAVVSNRSRLGGSKGADRGRNTIIITDEWTKGDSFASDGTYRHQGSEGLWLCMGRKSIIGWWQKFGPGDRQRTSLW
jgi:hypothetical protein